MLLTDLSTPPENTRSILEPAIQSIDIALEPPHPLKLATLVGPGDEHLKIIEAQLNVDIISHGAWFRITGRSPNAQQAATLLKNLYSGSEPVDHAVIQLKIREILDEFKQALRTDQIQEHLEDPIELRLKEQTVRPRGLNQHRYLNRIQNHVLNFGIGPAGTGKTYLAVACAVHALLTNRVKRLILIRPAVEAGEHLGFLPGTLANKIDPYLRPLYDALYEMLGFEAVQQALSKNIIEIAPLAYMRGRTLNDSFIILDESQNATVAQMKMFLTRIGFHSIAVATGDVTQIDLPKDKPSGLKHAIQVLGHIPQISFTFFESQDITRHPLVQIIVDAYEQHHDGTTSHIKKTKN